MKDFICVDWKRGSRWLPFFVCLLASNTVASELSKEELLRIGALIFHNECASQNACLTSWNKGEAFASLGIGHFIWYPEGVPESSKKFDESFPKLLAWMRYQGTEIPIWLLKQKGNPWKNRKHFEHIKNTARIQRLRDFLLKTRDLQVDFIKNRLKNALPRILQHISQKKRPHIRQQFQYVANSPMGFYPLMDYVNFKGEGIKLSERYQGKAWGLLQVLGHMQSSSSGLACIQDFANSAVFILTRRVSLSPPSRHENRWLQGWKKRMSSYHDEAMKAPFKLLKK
ncbi:MAG: hypothetical protein Q9M20_07805 [Mariprofundaceae bacterium]|nr:hypothetical protein [Mariprofundaceae bacterium]